MVAGFRPFPCLLCLPQRSPPSLAPARPSRPESRFFSSSPACSLKFCSAYWFCFDPHLPQNCPYLSPVGMSTAWWEKPWFWLSLQTLSKNPMDCNVRTVRNGGLGYSGYWSTSFLWASLILEPTISWKILLPQLAAVFMLHPDVLPFCVDVLAPSPPAHSSACVPF